MGFVYLESIIESWVRAKLYNVGSVMEQFR